MEKIKQIIVNENSEKIFNIDETKMNSNESEKQNSKYKNSIFQ